MYFYELHESDDDLFSEALLAHDAEYDEEEFLDLVQEARREVLGTFEEDSLVEAIANRLERTHGFVHIDDRRLRAAVRVSADEGETQISPVDELGTARDAEADDDLDGEFRSLLVDIEPEEQTWRNR